MNSKQVQIGLIAIAFGALTGGIGAVIGLYGAGVGTFTGAFFGALLTAVPILIGALLAKDMPDARSVATGSIEDVQLTTFTRTGRVPVVYGFRRVGANVIHLGNAEYKDVTVAATGRNESHLFADLLLGVAEGPCREVIAVYVQDFPRQIGTWRFQNGTDGDIAIPELEDTVPVGRNLRYPFTAKLFVWGDLGMVSNIPTISLDLRGIYPSVVREFSHAAAFTPLRATLDGPTNTLVIFPDPASVSSPRGIVTYQIPFENAPPVVNYTQPPTGVTANIQRAFYFGKVNSLIMQDPVNPRLWHFGRPGLARDSDEWESHDLGPAYENTVLNASRDDRTCRIFTLHEHDDGTIYQNTLSIVTLDQEQTILPDGGFTTLVKSHLEVEGNAWYMLVAGGGADRVIKLDRNTMQWSLVMEVSATDVVDMIKLGIMIYIFYGSSVTEIDTAGGLVTTGLPFSDFMSEDDSDALGDNPVCLAVAVSRHRYSGVATWESANGTVWRITCFHEPRSEGDSFPSPAPFRRYLFSKATAGEYIQKPGWPATIAIDRVVWITTGPVSAETPVEDMIAAGADYKTTRENASLPEEANPDGAVSSAFQSLVGAATPWQAIASRDDATSYVRMRPGDHVLVTLEDLADPGVHTDHVLRLRFRFAPGTMIGMMQWPREMRVQYMLYQGATLIASSQVYATRAPNLAGIWYEKALTLTTAQAAAISDYTDLRLRVEVTGVVSSVNDFVDVTWGQFRVGTGIVVALGSGFKAMSYYPVHNNAQEHRRVVFFKTNGSGTFDWFFTVRGELIRCAARDFETLNGTRYTGTATRLTTTTTQVVTTPPDTDDAFDACLLTMTGLPFGSSALVVSYDGGTGIITHTAFQFWSAGSGTLTANGPDWNMRLWSIMTPTEIELSDNGATGTPNPPYWMEGRLLGRGWTSPDTLEEIIEVLEDDGFPTGGSAIAYEIHDGPFDITAMIYARATWANGGGYYTPLPSLQNTTPFPPDAPLKQYRLDTADRPEWIYNTAAALNEAQMPGVMIDYAINISPPETCSSEAMTRDIYAINEDGVTAIVAASVQVASWEAFKIVVVRDEKAKYVEISVSATGFRHDWFEGRTTPGACRVDMLMNKRYGRGALVKDIDVASHLALHGWSLTKINVDNQVIRRFIWNCVFPEAVTLAEFDETVLTPASAYGITVDGRYSVVFDVPGVEPVMEFEGSLIEPGSFAVIINSPKASINRVVGRFYNAADQREDLVEIEDEDDQEATGEVREKEIALECVTDYRRAFYIVRQAMERGVPARLGISFTSAAIARMILDSGDPVIVSHPMGLWRRKAFRVTALEDTSEKVQIEAEEVTIYTMDDRGLTGIRSDMGGITGTHQGAGTSNALTRDRSIERFSGASMAPMRVLSVLRDDGTVLLLANRPPESQEVLGLRAKLVNYAVSKVFDELSVSEAKSVAIVDSIIEESGSYETTGLIETPERLQLPAIGHLSKRVGPDPARAVVQRVSVTALTGGGRFDGWTGGVTLEREAGEDDIDAELEDASVVYTVTESDNPPVVLEPVAYDGSGSSPLLWVNAGVWSDVTASVLASVGGPVAVLALAEDFLVIGWDGSGNWMPNCIEINLDTPAVRDLNLVIEFSCEPDDRLPFRVWKPLSILDATQGFTRSGRIHFEIPPDWVQTAAWDQHGNTTGGPGGSKAKMLWIRIQRRERFGSGAMLGFIRLENLPILSLEPLAPVTVHLPHETQGQSTEFRFIGRSRFRDDDIARLPGSVVRSTGLRWKLKPPSQLELVEPDAQAQELETGDTLASVTNVDYIFQWQYISASHGFGSQAFAETIMGVAVDPHLIGVHVTVRRQSDGLSLREESVPYPIDRWSYEWADRHEDGNVSVTLEFRQYDDRGFYSDPVLIGLTNLMYGYGAILGAEPTVDITNMTQGADNFACTLVGADGASQTFVIKHNLGSLNLIASLHAIDSPSEDVAASVNYTDANTITVVFTPAPGLGVDHRLVIDR